ncbi:2-methylaconitate cis-trans isomerase [Crenobacter luteus]|uniref:2-methylaconitate cis-trans isomerase PrpF family protein n=1 Tax=Crenobacter luteus TaxID=1452487 RepID=UPI00104756F0|nr:PrpF domain-containing protein [Crenobacter luteus]TCP12428.1 2-methylaconitate cis-trans isomerase [Crenobacter luteus]
MTDYYRLKASLMRGGTSKGLFFRADALPDDPALVQQLLMRAIGSPDPYGRQIDGLGTGISSTSKVAIIGPSSQPDCDVDYLFGHVAIGEPLIDWTGSCGNLTAAVPLFALMEKLASKPDGAAEIRIWQANTAKKIVAELAVKDGEPVLTGDFRVDGVAFPAAPITLRFLDPAGGVAGKLFPSGSPKDTLKLPDGRKVEATLIDAGNPTVFVRAADLELSGFETAAELDLARLDELESLRAQAAVKMGLAKTVAEATFERPAVPKISFISPARVEGTELNARIVSMGKLHHAYTGTGAIALATAAAMKDTVVSDMLGQPWRGKPLPFSHASGTQTLEAIVKRHGRGWRVAEVVMTRTARPLMAGEVFVPAPPPAVEAAEAGAGTAPEAAPAKPKRKPAARKPKSRPKPDGK